MQSPSSPRMKRLSIIGFTMIAVIIPFCFYYLVFVSSQTAYFSKRNFRVLAEIGDHMSSKVGNLATNLVNVAEKATQDKSDKTKVNGKAESDKKNKGGEQTAKPISDAQRVKEAASLVPDFKVDQVQYKYVQPPPPEKSNTVSHNRNAIAPHSKTQARRRGAKPKEQPPATAEPPATGTEPVTLSVKPDKGSFWLYLEYRSTSPALPGIFSVMSNLETHFEPFVSRYVIDELNQTNEKLFDEVLIAEDKTGRVIFQRGPALNVAALDSLSNDKGGKLELGLVDQSSSLADVRLAGANYKLYVQPATLTLLTGSDANKQEIRWVVCGLIRSDHFMAATYAAPYTVLIFFVFVVLLAVLSWPLLRLKLMGPKDRLRRADLALTLFSALMGSALVTFILLDLYLYGSLAAAIDGQLKEFSTGIKKNFREELGSALEQLTKLNGEIATLAANAKSGALKELEESKHPTPPNVESDGSSDPTRLGKANILAGGLDWKKASYPYFNSATWTDSDGRQRIKWTTRSTTTAYLDVSDRQFFKNTKDGRLWKLHCSDSDFDYCVESVKTKNTGENVAVIGTAMTGSSWTSSLDTRLLSLMGPALPAGYGFAVIDSGGQVLFHSDEVKNLEEPFFAECENNPGLRAAVVSRVDRHFDTQYLGKGHRMYVSALDGTPWTLVVFVDKQMARTVNLEVITLSMVLYLLFTLSVVALISLICLTRMIVFSGRYLPTDGDWMTWLWPASERAFHYELLTVFYVLIACTFIVALFIGGLFLIVCGIVLPLLAAGLWWLILRDAPPPARAAEDKISAFVARVVCFYSTLREDALARQKAPNNIVVDKTLSRVGLPYRTRYAIAFAGLLGIVSVLPAAGFFQIAHDFESRLMVKHGQVSIAKAIEQRIQRVASQYASIEVAGQKAKFLRKRLKPWPTNTYLDVYDSFLFGTVRADLSQLKLVDETPGRLDGLLLQIRPLYNQKCVESQGLAATASSDGLWSWKRDRDGHIFLKKEKDGRVGDPSLALRSSIPEFVFPENLWGWGSVIAIALLPLLVYGLIRFVTRRFFLLDTDLPTYIDLPLKTDLVGSYVYIRSSMRAEGNEWAEAHYERFDLTEVEDWRDLTTQLKPKAAATPESLKTVVLDNFEYCMDDPAASREKLLAIEYFLQAGRRVVVVSTVDPLNFSFTPKPSRPVGATAAQFSISIVPQPACPVGPNNSKVETATSQRVSSEGKNNGAADLKQKARVPYLPQTDAQARWTAVFTSFLMDFAADNSTEKFKADHSEFVRILKARKPWRYIEEIGKGLAENGTLKDKKWHDRAMIDEQIGQVVEQAKSYHKALWETCSEGQRCTLIQIAQDGMISPKNKHLRRLVKRGLVVRDPGLLLMDESFRRFVISMSRVQDMDAWRLQDGGSAWQLLKLPLLLILVSVALFLFITQKDVYDSTISFMTAVTAGIAALFKLLGMFHGTDKGGTATQS
jgi:hypothetical protein